MTRTEKPSPLVGEGGGEAVERGKCEQTGKKYLLNGRRTVYFSKGVICFLHTWKCISKYLIVYR